MNLLTFSVKMIKTLQNITGETGNHKLWNQRSGSPFFRSLAFSFYSYHRVYWAAVHVFHDEVNLALIKQASVISNLN